MRVENKTLAFTAASHGRNGVNATLGDKLQLASDLILLQPSQHCLADIALLAMGTRDIPQLQTNID
jgi:hypothetical protein